MTTDPSELRAALAARTRRHILLLLIGLMLLAAAMLVCASLGVTDASFAVVIQTIRHALAGAEPAATAEKVILNLRLPRIVLGALVGAGLAGSGAVMQGVSRNPLVSPFTIGISSAAAFGASTAIVFGFSFFGFSAAGVVTNAFIAAMLCAALVFLVSIRLRLTAEGFILTGIALNYLFQACSTAIQFIASEAKLAEVVAWSFGSLNGASWPQVRVVAAAVLVPSALLLMLHHPLTMMATLEDDIVKTMGVRPAGIRMAATILSVLMTAASISFTGVIGFVGLASPHIARALAGSRYRILLPLSMLTGSLLVVLADTVGRLILSPIMIPVGIVIAFIGVPVFVHQVIRSRRNSL